MFAGRLAQLDRLTRGLDAAAQGRTAAFALVGEPGIGKTRLATELSERAQKNGMRVLWGRAWEAGGAPALWPWRQLLPLETFETAAGEFAVSDREQARFAQFRTVLHALEQALDQGPLLCVLDDLHAADLASIELATFVLKSVRTRKLCLVCTWRDREAREPHLRDAIARLGREAEVLTLDRLSADESKALIGDRSDAAAIYRATAGNPLFLIETLRALGQDLNVDQLPVGEGISAVVRQRAARLDSRQRDLLGAASAIGREGELALLDEAMELKPGELEPLFATGLISGAGQKSFAFSHALVRDAIYLELEPTAREQLHEKLATVLHAGEPRAHHALLAPALKPEQVAAWTLEAAALMRSRTAWEEAAQLLERAVSVVKSPAARAELKLALGWALGDAGQGAAMQQCFQSVADQARTSKDADLFARAVLGIGSHYLFGDQQAELIALIDEALAMLGATSPSLHARLTARKAAAMTPAAEAEAPLELARAAWREVRTAGDARAQLEVAVAAGSAMGEFEPADRRVPVNTELVRLARELKEPVLELRGVTRLAADHFELGDVDRADAFLLERARLVQGLQLSRFDVSTPLFRSMRAMGAGDFKVCHESIAEVRRRAEGSTDLSVQRSLALHSFWLALLEDDRTAVAAALPEALRTAETIPGFPAMMTAAAHAQRGDAEAARRALSAVDERLTWLQSTMSLATVAQAAVRAGSKSHARAAYELLKPRAHLNATWGPIALVFGPPVSMTLGSLAAALSDTNAAATWFDAAAARAAPAHAAWVAFERGNFADARARALALAMPGLVARIDALGASDELSIEPQGSDWRVRHGARQVVVPNLKGMPMLAELVRHPNREIAAFELIGEAEGAADVGDAGELLDEHAKAEYRTRIRELTEELEEAEGLGHSERAERMHEELEALRKELSRAVDVHGKDRRAATGAERARIAARRRLRDAIARIHDADKELGNMLDQAIRTGAYCCYAPNRRK